MIFIYFTVSALAVILLTGVVLYLQMSRQLTLAVQDENQSVLGQINRSVDSRFICDAPSLIDQPDPPPRYLVGDTPYFFLNT